MGEDPTLFAPEFNHSLRVESRAQRVSGDCGGLLLRDVLERLGLTDWLVGRLHDRRRPDLITHPLGELLRTTLLLLAQGWRDQDDADTLRDDPVLRLAVSERRGLSPLRSAGPAQVPEGLASQPTLSRLVDMLGSTTQRAVLREALLVGTARRLRAWRRGHRQRYLTLDIDSLPMYVSGHQPQSEYNGHYHARIYHPLVATAAELGDLLDVELRRGAAHTADGAADFVLPLLDRVEAQLCQVAAVRLDAGFPEEQLLSALEQRRTPYVARVRNNAALDRLAGPFLRRPPGRPPAEPRTWTYDLTYQAETWSRPRRVVLVVCERVDELFLHHFWLITNWTTDQLSGQDLLAEYRQRGTAEGHLGELMDVLAPALSSAPRPKQSYRGQLPRTEQVQPCDAFAHNEVILLLNALAYNLAHTARCLLETATNEGWSLRRFRERVLRVAGRVILHSRYATVVICQTARPLWQALCARLGQLQYAGP